MANQLLEVKNISKAFSGVQALDAVSLTIERGKIHCLAGENGSGKSTLIKIIAGVYKADAGEIVIDGKSYQNLNPIDAIHEGIQVIYQDFSLFPNLTVAENIALNTQLAANKRLVNWREIREIAQEALDRININLDLSARVEEMSVANKQLIAISRAILQDARLIFMDEPTTALTQREVESLFKVIAGLQEKGIAIVFVSHKLNELLEISDRMFVLRNGKKVIEGDASEFNHSKLVYHMTGREISDSTYQYTPVNNNGPLLEVDSLSASGSFSDVSFDIYPGEIVGVTGLLGSGRTELALALFGVHPAQTGSVKINGQLLKIKNIQDAIKHGIGYVPEDRLTEGLFLPQSIGRNIFVRTVDSLLGRFGLVDSEKREAHVAEWVKNLSIKTNSPQNPARTLSGGNQQRVVLAKWLASSPKLLILNGPTVGVDIGSKSELHEIIKELARGGMGLLVISDEIPELMQTCNRILLMKNGQIIETFDRHTITEDQLAAKLNQG